MLCCAALCCAEAEVRELQDEFARRLGQADRRIEQLQARVFFFLGGGACLPACPRAPPLAGPWIRGLGAQCSKQGVADGSTQPLVCAAGGVQSTRCMRCCPLVPPAPARLCTPCIALAFFPVKNVKKKNTKLAFLQDEKERLRAQLALASQGSGASEARLAEKEEYISQLQ